MKLVYQCCFCGTAIDDTDLEPLQVVVEFKDEHSQSLWCHVDCLGSRLHSSVPWLTLKDLEEIEGD